MSTLKEEFLDRIASFKPFLTSTTKISFIKAAKANFRLVKDEKYAICDKCNARITYWEDDVDLLEMHKTNCSFLREYRSSGNEYSRNIPNSKKILKKYAKTLQPESDLSSYDIKGPIEKSYKNFPHLKSDIVTGLIYANFWYTLIGDTVICPDCRLVEKNWNKDKKPINVHCKRSPNCKFIREKFEDKECRKFNIESYLKNYFVGKESKYVSGLMSLNFNNIKLTPNSIDLSDLDNEPICKEMTKFKKRLETFVHLSELTYDFREELASGGYIFISKKENVYLFQCYHCSMKLRIKDETVNPTIFHAIWNPHCAFIVRRCGSDNVKKFASLPLFQNEEDQSSTASNKPTSFTNIDPREARARMDTPIVQLIVQQGRNWNTILRAIEIFMRRNGDDFTTATELLEVVEELENKASIERQSMPDTIRDNLPSPLPDTTPKTEEDYRRINEAIAEARRCKNIKDDGERCKETSNIVTLPCGCLGLCEFCADSVVYCKRCNHIIRGTVKIYRS